MQLLPALAARTNLAGGGAVAQAAKLSAATDDQAAGRPAWELLMLQFRCVRGWVGGLVGGGGGGGGNARIFPAGW